MNLVGVLSIVTTLLTSPTGTGETVRWAPSLLVQLRVADLDRSIRFYRDTLGFRIVERRDDLQFAHVDCGVVGLQIGLSAGGSAPPNPGTMTLNFGVQGEIEVARKALEEKGIVFGGATTVIPGKVRLADFKDPDGYRIRLAGSDVGR